MTDTAYDIAVAIEVAATGDLRAAITLINVHVYIDSHSLM